MALSKSFPVKRSFRNHWITYGYILIAENMDEAIEAANAIASEHMEIVTANPFEVMMKVRNAGAIFIGENSSEPLGDYFAGPNHVLPTNGTAKFFSRTFCRRFCKEIQHRILIQEKHCERFTKTLNSLHLQSS